MYGKALRLKRLLKGDGEKVCIVPVDHGLTLGPIGGLRDILPLVNDLFINGADGVILHKGILTNVAKSHDLIDGNFILHLSASSVFSKNTKDKALIASVEEAICHGAIGVSVHLNLGTDNENAVFRDLGDVSEACHKWGFPLICMMYNTNTVSQGEEIKTYQHMIRIAEEFGVDIIKIKMHIKPEEFQDVGRLASIPVILAGGDKCIKIDDFLVMLELAQHKCIRGISYGRNIFMAKKPGMVVRACKDVLNGKQAIEEINWEEIY